MTIRPASTLNSRTGPASRCAGLRTSAGNVSRPRSRSVVVGATRCVISVSRRGTESHIVAWYGCPIVAHEWGGARPDSHSAVRRCGGSRRRSLRSVRRIVSGRPRDVGSRRFTRVGIWSANRVADGPAGQERGERLRTAPFARLRCRSPSVAAHARADRPSVFPRTYPHRRNRVTIRTRNFHAHRHQPRPSGGHTQHHLVACPAKDGFLTGNPGPGHPVGRRPHHRIPVAA